MGIIVFLITLIFLGSSFFVAMPQQTTGNSLAVYENFQTAFFIHHSILFVFGLLLLTIIFYRSNFDRQFSAGKIIFYSMLQTVTVSVIGFFLAYGLLLVIAWVQLTIVSVVVNTNPQLLGIVTDTNQIITAIKTNNKPPQLIATDKEENKVLVSVVRATSSVSNLYGTTFLSSIPEFLVFPLHQVHSGMLLIDNTLIVTQINTQDMQAISPYIGYALVKAYFPYRKIRSYPKITFMDKKEYAAFRVDDAKKKIVTIDLQLKKVDNYISSYSAALTIEKDYQKSKSIKQTLADYQSYKDFFEGQKEALQTSAKHAVSELGLFKSPQSISIIYDTNNPHAIADYFETLTHEYLHYASYASDEKRFSSTFFEEGFTEYFARKAIENSLSTETNLGYPIQVKIIGQMTNMITESEFAEIYFHKDEDALERALDRVYGDGFYAKNEVVFESMMYATNKKDLVALANTIMAQIGGEELTEKDVLSNYSSL